MLRWGTTFAKRCKAVTSTGGSQWLGSFWTPTTFKASLRKSPCSLNLGSHLPKPLKHNEKKDACSDKTCNSKKFINCKTDPKRDLFLGSKFWSPWFLKGIERLEYQHIAVYPPPTIQSENHNFLDQEHVALVHFTSQHAKHLLGCVLVHFVLRHQNTSYKLQSKLETLAHQPWFSQPFFFWFQPL